jgi:RNA polymerase sigma factor (sigma-70 family)
MSDATPSFDAAFERLFRDSYATAYRLLWDREEAEDVAMEALARAHARWARLRQPPDPWVGTVARNLAIDRLRRRRRAAPPPPPPVVSGTEVERVDLVRAIGRLPRRQREAVSLRYLLDYSERETAEVMRCSVGSVKQHLSRASAALSIALDDLEAGTP